jgi:hypothetical protein
MGAPLGSASQSRWQSISRLSLWRTLLLCRLHTMFHTMSTVLSKGLDPGMQPYARLQYHQLRKTAATISQASGWLLP